MANESELMEKLFVPVASSNYPSLGSGYARAGYLIEFPNRLAGTGRNYYESKSRIPAGRRMSTAADELAIQLGLEKAGKNPREAKEFDDLFARNDLKIYMRQWTETGLRVTKGRDPTKYETDKQGRKRWAREVLIGNNVVGEILVPEGNRRVVVEWDEVFGLPSVTEDISWPHKPYTTHFWFNQTPDKDSKSGHYDVAVERRSNWHRNEDERCLVVDAGFARSGASSGGGFRPVRGSAAEVEFNYV